MKKEQLIDMEQDQLELLMEIIRRHIPNKTVWAYGSRVNWKANDRSDLDLVVFDCDAIDVCDFRTALEESSLLFSVDVMEWEEIPDNFKENIKRKYVVVQEKLGLEGWREVKLGEIAKIRSGKSNSQDAVAHGKYPLFDRSQLVKKSNRYLFDTTAIIVAGEGTEFPPRYYRGKFDLHQRAYSIYDFEGSAESKFVYYFMLSNKRYLPSVAVGSTVLSLRLNHFQNFPILLPSLPEQKAIAETLSSLDDKIDLLHRQNKTLEELAQTLFRKWFVEDSSGEWNENKFGDLVDFKKGRKPTRAESNQFECSAPQILIETFDTGKTLYSEREGMVFANGKDTLMVMDGASSGRLEIGFEGILGSTIGLYKPSDEFDYPFFIFCFLKSQEKYIRENTTGSAIPHADKKLVLNLIARFPNIKMVNKFEVIAESFFIKKQSNRKKIRTLENLRDTLLPKLMNGEIKIAN